MKRIENFNRYQGAIAGLESLVLSCALAGIDVENEQFQGAVQTTLDAIANNIL